MYCGLRRQLTLQSRASVAALVAASVATVVAVAEDAVAIVGVVATEAAGAVVDVGATEVAEPAPVPSLNLEARRSPSTDPFVLRIASMLSHHASHDYLGYVPYLHVVA